MSYFINIEIVIIALFIFVWFYINTKGLGKNKCKLEKFALFLYSIIFELILLVLLYICMYYFKITKFKIIFLVIFDLLIVLILNKLCIKIKFKYMYMNEKYNVNIIVLIEILLLKIYPLIKRIKRGCLRIIKELIVLIPIIIIEIFFIYCFSFFMPIEDKQWDIFELILTTIIITAYINVYNSERERRNNLKWQYKYCYFVENNMYDYIEKIMILIGITKEEKYKILDYLTYPSAIIKEIENYNETEHYKIFINKNIDNTEKIQKYIEDITETFINNLKENRNELIFIKENENNEDYLYHNCIDTANNLKRNILLSNINSMGDTILKLLPDIIYNCSCILKLVNSIWDEDDIYENRIKSILKEL